MHRSEAATPRVTRYSATASDGRVEGYSLHPGYTKQLQKQQRPTYSWPKLGCHLTRE
jgi:hypothetical protein